MGAKWLFQLRSAPGQQTSTLHLFDRFESLGARRICKWKTQTSYHKKCVKNTAAALVMSIIIRLCPVLYRHSRPTCQRRVRSPLTSL